MSGGEGALDKYWAFLKDNYRQRYSEIAADHIVYPRNTKELGYHNGFGIAHGEGDDGLAIWINVQANVITETAFNSEGCPTCTACGSAATEMLRGKTCAEGLALTSEDMLSALGGLPAEDHRCALLASEALRGAISDYFESSRQGR
jgi:nitrogen fixation NifU-like protein